jgi:hypothetical protein
MPAHSGQLGHVSLQLDDRIHWVTIARMASLEASLTLIGGPTVLIEFFGLRLLIDPTFDEPGTYEAAGIVLEKRKGPAFSIDALGVIDAVLLSHDQHFDNFDRTGRKVLLQARNTFTRSTMRSRRHMPFLRPRLSPSITRAGAISPRAKPTSSKRSERWGLAARLETLERGHRQRLLF